MSKQNQADFTKEELKLLSSKAGLKALMEEEPVNPERALKKLRYKEELRKRQVELVKVQKWVIESRSKVVVVFEGRDAAGKGGAIKEITAHINPRHYRSFALDKPDPDEEGQWYFQRYVNLLPSPGQIVFYDRSWYNRAIVEPVNGFCSQQDYDIFMQQVNEFERMIVQSDTLLIKFYFTISKEEQAKRFDDIRKSALKKWKMTPVDEKAQDLWDEYSLYEKRMLEHTNSTFAPWHEMDANDSLDARLKAMDHLLRLIPYKD